MFDEHFEAIRDRPAPVTLPFGKWQVVYAALRLTELMLETNGALRQEVRNARDELMRQLTLQVSSSP